MLHEHRRRPSLVKRLSAAVLILLVAGLLSDMHLLLRRDIALSHRIETLEHQGAQRDREQAERDEQLRAALDGIAQRIAKGQPVTAEEIRRIIESIGVKGERGATGNRGAPGRQGPTGPQGPGGTVRTTTTTRPPPTTTTTRPCALPGLPICVRP